MQRLAAVLLLAAVVDGARSRKRRKTNAAPLQPMQEEKEDGSAQELDDELRRFADASPEPTLSLEEFPKCHLSESDCSIKDMSEATLVYTDSATSRCWNGDPFAFVVIPGRSDKLLYFFPAGGVCIQYPRRDEGAFSICVQDLDTAVGYIGFGAGFTEYNNSRNPFWDYTLVSNPYCTGGIHMANNTVSIDGTDFYQYDYNNNNFTISWALRNMDKDLESFAIIGSSAGSLGAMGWSDYMLSTFRYNKATVILDSYVGLFPEGTAGPTVRDFGVCSLPMLKPFKAACEEGTANVQDIVDYTIGRHPTVAFAHVQPKWDILQRAFHIAVAAIYRQLDLYISSWRFYEEINKIMHRYSRHPNFAMYYVAGGYHCFMSNAYLYGATVAGKWTNETDGKPALVDWVAALVDHQPVQSQCKGPLKENGGGSWWGTQYCDEKLFPKTLDVSR